ncbi:MAG: zinc ribbon domain-containing protein [Bacilli bacterium]|nr:zinc ribbon domain-containing protein [Bacilli bacterium]
MKCIKCGQDNNDALKYCTQCGYPLGQGEGDVSPKKKSKKGLIIILLLVIILGVLAAGYFFFFNNQSNKTNVERMDTALANLYKTGNQSGTVKMKMELSAGYTIELNAFMKYAKQNDKYYFQLSLEKSLFMDEANMYAILDNNTLNLYVQSSIMNMFDSTRMDNNSWLTYSYDYSDMGIDLNNLDKSNIKVDSSKIFTSNNLKYIDKKDGLSHYRIIFDKDFVNSTNKNNKASNEEVQQIVDMNLSMDVYIDSDDNIAKMVIDASDYFKKQNIGMDKAIFTIEFTDLNKTVVTIPDEALNAEYNMNNYLDDYDNLFDEDYDDYEDYDDLLDDLNNDEFSF